MKNIDKLYPIWMDLDSSYETIGKRLGCTSKIQYLCKLVYDNNGNNQLNRLKMCLSSEVSDYTSEENIKYTNVLEVLNALEFMDEEIEALKDSAGDGKDILSLNALVMRGIVEKSTLSNTTTRITMDDLKPKNKNHSITKKLIFADVLLATKGFYRDVVCTNGSSSILYQPYQDLNNKELVILNDRILSRIPSDAGDKINSNKLIQTSLAIYKVLSTQYTKNFNTFVFADKSIVKGLGTDVVTVTGITFTFHENLNNVKIYKYNEAGLIVV